VESVSFVGIDIKVVAWDERADRAVAEDWLEVPPAVEAHNVEDYVFGRFGEPVDVAVSRTDEFGELVTGWVFSNAALERTTLPSEGLHMMVVPFVRFPDGTRQELFEYNAELHREFAALVGVLEPAVDVLGTMVPAESTGRLEDERPTLVGAEREQLELQLGGWLRRMLVEGWTYLILEVSHSGRYVQFLTHDGAWLRGEAVGERYLDGHPPLSNDEHESLCSLGWNPPGSDGDDCGNYWVDWGDDVDDRAGDRVTDRAGDRVTDRDIDEAGRFAAATLCDIFDVTHADEVQVITGAATLAED